MIPQQEEVLHQLQGACNGERVAALGRTWRGLLWITVLWPQSQNSGLQPWDTWPGGAMMYSVLCLLELRVWFLIPCKDLGNFLRPHHWSRPFGCCRSFASFDLHPPSAKAKAAPTSLPCSLMSVCCKGPAAALQTLRNWMLLTVALRC